MWHKAYRVNLGAKVTPQQAVAAWKSGLPGLYPAGIRLAGPLGGLTSRDAALLAATTGGVTGAAVEVHSICLDSRRQWRQARNVWRGASVHGVRHAAGAPLAAGRRPRAGGTGHAGQMFQTKNAG